MQTRRRLTVTTALVALTLSVTTAAVADPGSGHAGAPGQDGRAASTFAVIGDIPYGDAEVAAFPARIAQLNADRNLQLVQHLGDIKNGSSFCSNEYFAKIRADFDRFRHPFVYAVGDNEWTDCHRPNNGAYNPLERLDRIRSTFFQTPDRTLGTPSVPVRSQAAAGYPEESRYQLPGVSVASLHIVGSNNSLAPWTGQTQPTPEQAAEVLGRTADSIGLIRQTFATAKANGDRAVALMLQADMFDPTVPDKRYADYYGFTPIVRAIAQESRAFGKPVYLFNGDSHVYESDRPLAAGSPYLAFYGAGAPVPNLQRVTVDGSNNAKDYLRVTVTAAPKGADRKSPDTSVLTWERVPFTS